jgi:hypothetical protein
VSQAVFLQVVEEVGVSSSPALAAACSSLFFLPSLSASVCWSLQMSRVVNLSFFKPVELLFRRFYVVA